jgi:hypothetical protein
MSAAALSGQVRLAVPCEDRSGAVRDGILEIVHYVEPPGDLHYYRAFPAPVAGRAGERDAAMAEANEDLAAWSFEADRFEAAVTGTVL